jgi:hypothetical protein
MLWILSMKLTRSAQSLKKYLNTDWIASTSKTSWQKRVTQMTK